MTFSDYISIAALLIASCSFGVSLYFGLRDKGRIKATSKLHNDNTLLTVRAVNHGRRLVVLTMLGAHYDNGASGGTYLGDGSKGVRLAEHEKYDETLNASHHMIYEPEDGTWVNDLWFEDTLGRRYDVKDAKQNLLKLLKK